MEKCTRCSSNRSEGGEETKRREMQCRSSRIFFVTEGSAGGMNKKNAKMNAGGQGDGGKCWLVMDIVCICSAGGGGGLNTHGDKMNGHKEEQTEKKRQGRTRERKDQLLYFAVILGSKGGRHIQQSKAHDASYPRYIVILPSPPSYSSSYVKADLSRV